jgi:hypothetical protein
MHFYIIEFVIIILFILTLIHFRKNKRFLIFSFIFACLFEIFGVFISGYLYSNDFLLNIYGVPIFIILSWVIILTTSYNLISTITNHKLTKAILVSLSATALDLVFEASAVFLNFWTWKVTVPNILVSIDPANFIGWMIVSFCFVYLYELNYKAGMLFSFPFYVFLGISYKIIYDLIFKNSNIDPFFPFFLLFTFVFVLAVYLLYKNYKFSKNNLWWYSFLLRVPFLIFGVFFSIKFKLFIDNYILLFIVMGLLIEIVFLYLSFSYKYNKFKKHMK